MNSHDNPYLRLRGGANANDLGYNPNFTTYHYPSQPASSGNRSRSRSRSRARQQGDEQEQQHQSSPPSAGPSGWGWFASWRNLLPSSGLAELTRGGWRPVRPRFDVEWPDDEIYTLWYEAVYADLYTQVWNFVKGYFGFGDLPVSSGVWSDAGLSEQFRWFVSKVAMQDNNAGGWDALLVKGDLREYLVMGVIGKALETSVFDDLLFGADKSQKSMLEAQDECTLEFDGYHRTRLRAECVRTILAGNSLTPEFWSSVDKVSLQLMALLLPLIRLMHKHFPATESDSLPSIYQDLHTIVAEAGYLSLGIRWSRTVFRFSFPTPGQVWDIDQDNVDGSVFEASKAANDKADKTAEAIWRVARNRRRREAERRPNPQSLADQSLNRLKGVWKRVMGPDDRSESETDKAWRRPSRIAKVQVVLWPMLERFVAVGHLDHTKGADGEEVTTVFKSKVVYFYGRATDDEGPDDHYPSLENWMRQNKQASIRNLVHLLRWPVYAAVAWLVLSFAARYSPLVDDVQQVIRYGLVGLATYMVREVALFVVEVSIAVMAIVTATVKAMLFLAYSLTNALGRLLSRGSGSLPETADVLQVAEEEVRGNGAGYTVSSWEWTKRMASGLATTLFGSQ